MSTDKRMPTDEEQDMDADISPIERSLLDQSIENSLSVDNDNLSRSALDNFDDEGDLLNEEIFAEDVTGGDLDVPGSELDDANEDIGEEDEENNSYSQADTE